MSRGHPIGRNLYQHFKNLETEVPDAVIKHINNSSTKVPRSIITECIIEIVRSELR